MRNALLVVDLQNDFMESGSLPVPGATQVAAHVARHVRHFRSEYAFVVATRDYHEDPPDHFSDTPDYINTWPKHGLIGTQGAALVTPIFNLVREKIIQVVVDKGRHAGAVSAFEGQDLRGHPLVDILREQRVDHIDICGLITRVLHPGQRARRSQARVPGAHPGQSLWPGEPGGRPARVRGDEGSRLPADGRQRSLDGRSPGAGCCSRRRAVASTCAWLSPAGRRT